MTTAPIGLGIFSLPLILLFGSALTAPLSGPPLPLDPALSAIAPAECILYASSAGVAIAELDSSNQTEQLYAEPEVRDFIDGIRDQVMAIIAQSSKGTGANQIIATELPKLVGAFLHRPTAAFLEELTLSEDKLEIRAGLVLNAGGRREELASAISNLVELSLEQGLPIGSFDGENGAWHVMRMSMQTPEIRWGWHDDYFVLAAGDGVADDIIERLDGDRTPTWLEKLRQGDSIERESSLFHINIQALLNRLKPQIESEGAWSTLEKLGLTKLQSFDRRAGFDSDGCSSQAKLTIDGAPRGLLELIPDEPLSSKDLQLIPKNAMLAAAVRFDLSDAWDIVLRLGKEFDPSAVNRIENNIRLVEEKLGFHLEHDLINSLDDVWTAYLPEGDLMSAWIGSTFAVQVKNAPRLRVAVAALVNDLRAKLPPGGQGLQLSDTDFEGQTIYTARFVGQPIPVSPAWCVTDDWFFLGLNPQTVRNLITRRDRDSLAKADEIRDAFASRDAPTALAYIDSPKLVRAAYPFVQMGVQMLSGQLERQGISIDPSILPSSNAVVPHLRPYVGSMVAGSDGPRFTSRHSLPSNSTALAGVPLVLGSYWSFSPISRRSMNPEVADINNLKNLALAFLNYESAYGKFPTNIYDENGEALLSWRVRLLPFMEQQALYDQFHLDEPWDSLHNKPLSETIIRVYASPDGPAGGKTRYLALAGKETLFPGNEELGMIDVRDGTSNTILFVQAARDQAVPWSKPQDIVFDTQQPFRGIKNPSGRFATAMNDGSCRYLTMAIGDETMKAMATRDGGERIDREKLRQ